MVERVMPLSGMTVRESLRLRKEHEREKKEEAEGWYREQVGMCWKEIWREVKHTLSNRSAVAEAEKCARKRAERRAREQAELAAIVADCCLEFEVVDIRQMAVINGEDGFAAVIIGRKRRE